MKSLCSAVAKRSGDTALEYLVRKSNSNVRPTKSGVTLRFAPRYQELL
jgi:hypothetical protein